MARAAVPLPTVVTTSAACDLRVPSRWGRGSPGVSRPWSSGPVCCSAPCFVEAGILGATLALQGALLVVVGAFDLRPTRLDPDERLLAGRAPRAAEWIGAGTAVAALALITVVALVLRVVGIDSDLWLDEIVTVRDYATLPPRRDRAHLRCGEQPSPELAARPRSRSRRSGTASGRSGSPPSLQVSSPCRRRTGSRGSRSGVVRRSPERRSSPSPTSTSSSPRAPAGMRSPCSLRCSRPGSSSRPCRTDRSVTVGSLRSVRRALRRRGADRRVRGRGTRTRGGRSARSCGWCAGGERGTRHVGWRRCSA